MGASLSEIIQHKVLPRPKTCSYAERFHSQSALKHTHLKLAFSTLYYYYYYYCTMVYRRHPTDANFVANATIAVVSKAASVASHHSRSFLPITMIEKRKRVLYNESRYVPRNPRVI